MTAAPPTKKTKLFETSDNPDVELIFEHVDQIQEKIEKLVDEEADKILEVQMDFINKRKPIFEERNNIIRQIPGFWLKAVCTIGASLSTLKLPNLE
jgi:template-activating factor I